MIGFYVIKRLVELEFVVVMFNGGFWGVVVKNINVLYLCLVVKIVKFND